jgi:predicted dinucleotide-binding enzyme
MLGTNKQDLPHGKTSGRTAAVMNVAIIGSGNVGRALGAAIVNAGYAVTLTASDPDNAAAAATAIGASVAPTNRDAASDADIVIVAVPYPAEPDVAAEIREAVAGKPVVDVANPMNSDLSGSASETSAAEELQAQLPDAHVVKAFNTIFASNQANPRPEVDGYVAGDDPDAKREVMSLVEAMGFRPIDVGSLRAARALEAMAIVNIGINVRDGGSWTSAWKLDR